jgi:hypothetical protein
MPAVGRRRPQRPNRHYDPQPRISALSVAFLPHPFDHLRRHRRGMVAVLGDPLMGGAVDVVIGDGHVRTIHDRRGLISQTRPRSASPEQDFLCSRSTLHAHKVLSIGKQENGDLGAKLLRRDGFYEVSDDARLLGGRDRFKVGSAGHQEEGKLGVASMDLFKKVDP